MRRRNLFIVVLLLAGILLFAIMEGLINPKLKAEKERYTLEQEYALTHDFASVLKYKTRYMGNASNFGNLNSKLPPGNVIPHTLQLYPEQLSAEIIYKESSASLDTYKLRQNMLYSATANFVLIDNLKALTFRFTDRSYSMSRSDIETWFKTDLSSLQNETSWEEHVRSKLKDEAAVNSFFDKG